MNTPFYFAQHTSPETREVFKEADFCVLPWGSMEQHGSHLPLSTDSLIASGILNHLMEKLAGSINLAVLPPLVYGRSPEHAGFPGTVSLSMNTMTGLVRDICRSIVRHGGRKLLILNAHGGNTAVLGGCLREVREETGITPLVFELYQSRTIGSFAAELDYHAGEVETSIMLYLYPDMVKQNEYPSEWKYTTRDVAMVRLNFPWKAEDLSTTGVIGDPKGSRAELGKEIVLGLCEELSELLVLAKG